MPSYLKMVKAYIHHRLKNTPQFLSIEVTYNCNAKCGTCEYFTIRGIKELQDYVPVVQKLDPLSVDFTGGEPLLRKDLVHQIKNIRKHCTNVAYMSMNTNAWLLNPDKAYELKTAGLDAITISLDFIGKEHDKNRVIPGLYNHILKLIPELNKMNFMRIQLHSIISIANIDHLIPINELALDLNVKSSFVTFSNLRVGAETFQPKNKEDISKIKNACDDLLKRKKKYKNITNSSYYLKMVPHFFENGNIPGCTAGLKWFTISPDGFVKPCADLEPICYYTDFSPDKKLDHQPCGKCWVKCRGENQTGLTLEKAKSI